MGTTAREVGAAADAAMIRHIEEVVRESSIHPEVLWAERYPAAETLEAEKMVGKPRRGRF